MNDIHLVQRWGDISHKRHKQEGYLEDRFVEVFKTIQQCVIPCRLFHVRNEGHSPDTKLETNDLKICQLDVLVYTGFRQTRIIPEFE